MFSSALSKPKYKEIIDKYFNQIAKKDETLTSLNTAFASEGAFINIPKSKVADKPVEIVYFSTKNTDKLWLNPRNLVIVGENACLELQKLNGKYLPDILIAGSKIHSNLPLLKDRYIDDNTLIYWCENKACNMPVENLEALNLF